MKCVLEIRSSLQNGEPARQGVQRYLESARGDDAFAGDIRRFLFAWDQGRDWRSVAAGIKSPYRRAIIEILASAFGGQPILAHIEELQRDLESATDLEIRRHIELLPLRMLMPLLFLQFPAFLLLLFGPLLRRLVEEINK